LARESISGFSGRGCAGEQAKTPPNLTRELMR
jgi:hypothetical protein